MAIREAPEGGGEHCSPREAVEDNRTQRAERSIGVGLVWGGSWHDGKDQLNKSTSSLDREINLLGKDDRPASLEDNHKNLHNK